MRGSGSVSVRLREGNLRPSQLAEHLFPPLTERKTGVHKTVPICARRHG